MKNRIISIDIFRALTMFFMLFVNDIPGLKGVPHWLFHATMEEDMLGFSDTIFPAFLFCVGMSAPYAIEARFRKGDNHLQVLSHILIRTFSLIAMGLLTLNCSDHGMLSESWFMLLMFIGIMLTWMEYPKGMAGKFLKWLGACLLFGMVVYSDVSGSPFETSWWGILGLIGWTYCVVSFIYLFTRNNLLFNTIAWILTIVLCVMNNVSFIPNDYFIHNLLLGFIPGGWTHHALGMSGVMASLWMGQCVKKGQQKRMICCFAGLGLAFLNLGLCCHKFWIISKILATPTWLFLCLGIYFPLLALIYWWTDMKGKWNTMEWLRPAGTATLTCYLLPYGWYALKGIFHLHVPETIYYGWLGVLLSLLFSFITIQCVRLLLKGNYKLKL